LLLTFVTLPVPLIEAFGFRQTQTTLSVYWMLKEHAFIDYSTPVLGAPWQLPFEAPVYQVAVAALVALTGGDPDACGRIVAPAFFCGMLWCAYQVLRELLPASKRTVLLFVVAMLASPHVVFWARTFMIESCAEFFSMA